ncbi:spore germination protein GerW family protein [Streptodolium elevatio]|uniref:Spore germination protein GerW family protein n=1 Tax=Streptodolium elevatio TaxID=3157996 RepID=A0ABV3DHL1_9ACTN
MSEPEHPELAGEHPDSAQTAASLLERLVDRITARASVAAVFGEPIEHAGVTVVPVARIAFGFGGGAGRGLHTSHAGEGGGGGGGADSRPLGFIEITDRGAAFKPIRDPWADVVLPVAALLAAAAPGVVRVLRRRGR